MKVAFDIGINGWIQEAMPFQMWKSHEDFSRLMRENFNVQPDRNKEYRFKIENSTVTGYEEIER
jgi:hypothetical protein